MAVDSIEVILRISRDLFRCCFGDILDALSQQVLKLAGDWKEEGNKREEDRILHFYQKRSRGVFF